MLFTCITCTQLARLAAVVKFFWGGRWIGGHRGDLARREMKQTLLTFGGKVAKCTGVHEKLQTIRSCKQCYTISSLRRRCTSTISFKTGQPLGKYGTKNQLLARLIENAELHKNNGKFVCFIAFEHYFLFCFAEKNKSEDFSNATNTFCGSPLHGQFVCFIALK